jgi:DNA-binding MarR family transcriptional regulator
VLAAAALDLLREPGGRLNHRMTSVLGVIAAHPGLNNRGVARRAGVKDEGHASSLSRLERLGLIEDLRGAQTATASKAWQLTASGVELEGSIANEIPTTPERREPPSPVTRSAALDLVEGTGGRLNNRAVSVLKVIAAEPGLSNSEVADRVGIRGKSHISKLLARLAQRDLIENTVDAGLPFEANAWQLTTSGRQLETAIRHDSRATTTRTPRTAHRTTPTEDNR